MIKKRGGMRRRLDRSLRAPRIDRRSRSRIVASRLRRPLARAARDLPVPVRPDPHRRRDGRGAGAVHLRDLLTDGRFRELVACPACGGTLSAEWSCARCAARFDGADGVPDLRLPSDDVTETVRRFYESAPFPGYPPRESSAGLRARAERNALRPTARPRDSRRCAHRRRRLRHRPDVSVPRERRPRGDGRRSRRAHRFGSAPPRPAVRSRARAVRRDRPAAARACRPAPSTSSTRRASCTTRRTRARRSADWSSWHVRAGSSCSGSTTRSRASRCG